MNIKNLEDKSREEELCEVKTDNWVFSKNDSRDKDDEFGITDDDLNNPSHAAKFALTLKAFQFTESFTMHGVRNAFSQGTNRTRRFFWVLIILMGMTYCGYICYQTLNSYYEYPAIIKTTTTYERSSPFPAVTICNFNAFQNFKLTEDEETALSIVFGSSLNMNLSNNVATENVTNILDYANVTKLFIGAAFDYNTGMSYYKENKFSKSLISPVLTDFGLCIKFDPSKDIHISHQAKAGLEGGFYWGASFIPAHWTIGPHYYGEGFRVAVHQPGTTVYNLVEEGISIEPGVLAELVVSRKVESYLEPPYGQCGSKTLAYFDTYTRRDCFFECKTNHTVGVCGCKFAHMPGPSPVCSLRQIRDCKGKLADEDEERNILDPSRCTCQLDCEGTYYEISATKTNPSKGYITLLENSFGFNVGEGVSLKVFYQDLKVTETIQEKVYTIEKLLCDIGGAAGLFLGCSVVTIIELIDFLIEFAWFWTKKGALLRRGRSLDRAT